MPSQKTKLPYLSKRSETDGYFFLRRVPRDLVEAVVASGDGLAETLREARLRLREAVAKTDQLITDLHGLERLPKPFRAANSP